MIFYEFLNKDFIKMIPISTYISLLLMMTESGEWFDFDIHDILTFCRRESSYFWSFLIVLATK